MSKPDNWKGSDLRARTEVTQYLKRHGGEVTDKSGLVVGQLARDLGKGRAVSQLIADMAADGMIEREVRGKRTFAIRLLDDWGLAGSIMEQAAKPHHNGASVSVPEGTDLDLLAEALLAIVVHKASVEPQQAKPDPKLVDRLNRAEQALEVARGKLSEATGERDELREQVRVLTHNVETLMAQMDKQPRRKDGVSLRERLDPSEVKMLDQLMRSLPTSPHSRDEAPTRRTRTRQTA